MRPHPYHARYFLDRREDARLRARLSESASLSRADWEVVFERLDVDGGAIAGERS